VGDRRPMSGSFNLEARSEGYVDELLDGMETYGKVVPRDAILRCGSRGGVQQEGAGGYAQSRGGIRGDKTVQANLGRSLLRFVGQWWATRGVR
jgi:hypothetical protein